MEKRELTCIRCPLGCNITVTLENGQVTGVTGNNCNRGDSYVRKEVTNPTRILTSTVRVSGGTAPVVSVKTRTDIPKEKLWDCIHALKAVIATAPVAIGDVLLSDAAGTGVDIVATKNVEAR